MDGTRRHSIQATGALALGLLSASVLLALVWGGAVARADSSGIQYSDVPPTVTGDNTPTSARKDPGARSSQADGGATAVDPSDESGSQASGNKSSGNRSSSQGDKPTDDTDGGTGQSSPDAGSGSEAKGTGEDTQAVVPLSSNNDDDGSSPLLPILIAILVLAAVSAAVFLLRARRRDAEPRQPGAPSRAS